MIDDAYLLASDNIRGRFGLTSEIRDEPAAPDADESDVFEFVLGRFRGNTIDSVTARLALCDSAVVSSGSHGDVKNSGSDGRSVGLIRSSGPARSDDNGWANSLIEGGFPGTGTISA